MNARSKLIGQALEGCVSSSDTAPQAIAKAPKLSGLKLLMELACFSTALPQPNSSKLVMTLSYVDLTGHSGLI
ncbi:MAG: hypothetical protein Fur0046_01300 [Cyanobacteria bacterium J069]